MSAHASRAVSGLGGFGAYVAAQGLGDALSLLGLEELRGRSAVEVVARVAEHLSSHVDGLDRPLLTGALRDTLLEVANLDESFAYQNLEESLKSFLDANGVDGLVETFLVHLICDPVWSLVEQWVQEKSDSNEDTEALRSSVEGVCRQLARKAVGEMKAEGRFESLDWFGAGGATLGEDIVHDVERRLNNAAERGAR